ncbi:hypothetical protein D5086_000053 [Populus alba]|uniref:Uncharacterized protein n=2 Tax=Populus TaxID=3689 RepID=A0ACC4CW02_POPAL|nr:peptidyl-tRNA hydrolase [Populus alba x Populus x berolinensis]
MLNRVSRRCFCTAAATPAPTTLSPWLFVGLGNPGEKFKGTRHNAWFVGDAPVLLAKPQTYMNLRGESAGPLAAYYKLPLNRVIVFHDDMELPCGVLRLQEKGGHGCHRGLKSVINQFRGNREFARLRIGIGRPPGQMDPKAFLLQKFNATARERIDAALPEGVVALRCILFEGLTRTARWFNQEQKYKYIRSETMST